MWPLDRRTAASSRGSAAELPAIYDAREFVQTGGLISYGPSLVAMQPRVAEYVDKIFKGAKPGDLPVEQPRKFELVINLKAAKALGLAVPPALLARRRGDRIAPVSAAAQNVCFWHKADITIVLNHVCFRGQSGHHSTDVCF